MLSLLTFVGCDRGGKQTIVLYTSVDEPIAAPIIAEFERQTGIHVLLKTDTEATKSVGLAAALEAERDNPRADVWWSNEVFHTIRLADAGLLAPYASPAADDIPPKFKDPQSRWASSGLRARVLIAAAGVDAPKNLRDLTQPRFKDRLAMADPAFGTTGGHVAALYVMWGQGPAREFFRALKANGVKLVGGNSIVADEVAKGSMLAGLTDNDDAASARRAGGSLQVALPDDGGAGTLGIPTTVGLVTHCKNPELARRLIDYLLSAQVERKLIDAQFAMASVRGASGMKFMDVDYAAVAQALPAAVADARAILRSE